MLARTGKGREIEREVHDVGQFFIPIFFVVVGAAVDLRTLTMRYLAIGLALAAIGIVGKVAAGFAVMQRGVKRIVVGAGMMPRGEVGLIFARIGLTANLLTGGLYSAVALMVIVTTFVTPLVLRRLLDRAAGVAHDHFDFAVDAPLEDERRASPR